MFRKSGYIREHEKSRSNNTSMESNPAAFSKEDIDQYKQTESKEFFVNQEEESEKEKQIKNTITSLQTGRKTDHILPYS